MFWDGGNSRHNASASRRQTHVGEIARLYLMGGRDPSLQRANWDTGREREVRRKRAAAAPEHSTRWPHLNPAGCGVHSVQPLPPPSAAPYPWTSIDSRHDCSSKLCSIDSPHKLLLQPLFPFISCLSCPHGSQACVPSSPRPSSAPFLVCPLLL